MITYYPSTPLIPIPTWAAVIILTSLAPSPTANVETFGSYIINIYINKEINIF